MSKSILKLCFQLIWLITISILTEPYVVAQDTNECKFLTALYYLRTNAEINSRIKEVFPRSTKKRAQFIEFKLSSRIDFLSISSLSHKMVPGYLTLPEGLLANEMAYYEKYSFDSYDSEFLKSLSNGVPSDLFLTFSRPVDNYLIAEMGDFDPIVNRKVKYGMGMKILFKFNSIGFVESVIYGVSAYN